MKRDVILFVDDILERINKIENYIKGYSKEKFLENEMFKMLLFEI